MADYQNATVKLINLGLNIALPPDLIGEGRYTRLTNVRTLQEGQLTSRFGLTKSYGRPQGVPIDATIVYMSRVTTGKMLFVWSSGHVYVEDTPLEVYDYFRGVGWPRGDIPRYNLVLVYPDDYSIEALRGSPAVDNISVVRFVSHISGDDWAYLATEIGMWKINKDGIGYKWGIRPPVELVTEVGGIYDFHETRLNEPVIVTCPPDDEGDRDCGLKNTADPYSAPYVWVYTYYSSHTGAESNACGEMTKQLEDFWSTAECPDPDDPPPSGPDSECQKAVKLEGFIPPTDPQVDRYRIYRKGGGNPTYRLEDEIPIYQDNDRDKPTTYYLSYKYDVQIAQNPTLTDANYVPFTTVVSPSGDPDPYGYKSVDPLLEDEISGPQALFETPMGCAWGPYQGSFIFATGDAERPGVVYWTNGGYPDSSSAFNELQVTSAAQPLVAGFVFGGNSYVWSKDDLFALDYSGQSVPQFIPRQIPMGLGLSAPNAFAVGPNGVYFLSKDGIYVTDCTTFANPITKDSLRPIFLGQSASEFEPLDWSQSAQFKMAVIAQELHFLYIDSAGDNQHLVFDIQHNRWQKFLPSTVYGTPMQGIPCAMVDCVPDAYCDDSQGGARCIRPRHTTAIYGDVNVPQYESLLALSDGNVYILSYEATGADEYEYDLGATLAVNFRTGAADAGSPLTQKEFGVLLIDADMPASAGCVVTPFYDAEQVQGTSFSLATSGRQTKSFNLEDVYKKNISLDFAWAGNGTIYQVVVQWRLDEEEVVHWFAPADALGIRGWKHVRDGYFALRSTTDVRLTIVVDGENTFVYTIPSTNGELLSTHLWFDPIKGKMYQFSIDSVDGVTPFRVYSDDTFVNVKQWNTGNSYTPFKIGGAGGYST